MGKINEVVTLNDLEQKICKHLATKRHQNARNHGITNARKGGQSDFETDYEGMCAEFAFCKLFNIFPDLTIEVRSSSKGTDDGDAILSNGMSVDVKATKYATGKLIAATWKQPKVEVYALMVGQSPNYTFKGFMKQEELLQQSRIGDLGRGPIHIAQQNELVELDQL